MISTLLPLNTTYMISLTAISCVIYFICFALLTISNTDAFITSYIRLSNFFPLMRMKCLLPNVLKQEIFASFLLRSSYKVLFRMGVIKRLMRTKFLVYTTSSHPIHHLFTQQILLILVYSCIALVTLTLFVGSTLSPKAIGLFCQFPQIELSDNPRFSLPTCLCWF